MCCMKQVLQCFIVLFQMLKQSRTELLYLCHTILQFYSSQVCSSAPQVTHHWKSTFVLGQDSINQNLGMEWTSASMVMKWSGFLMLLTIPPICTCPNHRPASKRLTISLDGVLHLKPQLVFFPFFIRSTHDTS